MRCFKGEVMREREGGLAGAGGRDGVGSTVRIRRLESASREKSLSVSGRVGVGGGKREEACQLTCALEGRA